jgi:hypothetical protein
MTSLLDGAALARDLRDRAGRIGCGSPGRIGCGSPGRLIRRSEPATSILAWTARHLAEVPVR